ncbi:MULTISPECIES: hypothetical protein [unclassified Crossiella]|uniref:hypothetical protein n=1 Tax=unclassified Crossiella TaxID=2620835 RepID=UPI001FFF7FC4|nr:MULTISPECIES: hypothetical protein [unclassified Crossiella]MCK2243671.1 hypothetical protein [Crossiella sp. S99.2]MCK2257530.1 hypothetical protein [Crossiella sp. S99.1]
MPPRSAGLVLAVELPSPWITPTGQPYTDWRDWLRPGGVLAVLTTNPAGTGCFANHTGLIVAAAQAAGLTYRQHIVTIQAHPGSDQPGDPHAPAAPSSSATGQVHVSAHLDLLIFTADQGGIR